MVLVLQEYPDGAAIKRVKDDGVTPLGCQPFVYAYHYDKKSQTWDQGHYFQNLEDLGCFIKERLEGGN